MLKTFFLAFVLIAALGSATAYSAGGFDDPVPECAPCSPPAN